MTFRRVEAKESNRGEEKAKRKYKRTKNENKKKLKSRNNKNNVDKKAQKEERRRKLRRRRQMMYVGALNVMRSIMMNVMIVRYGLNVSHATNGTTLIVQHSNLMIA